MIVIASRIPQPAASPLSLHRHLPERSSPSRVRFAAQNQRALDRSGPFRKPISDKGKGAKAKSTSPSLLCAVSRWSTPSIPPLNADSPRNPNIRPPYP
jgi:hypothetical protein